VFVVGNGVVIDQVSNMDYSATTLILLDFLAMLQITLLLKWNMGVAYD
jgi:hypothetical protein